MHSDVRTAKIDASSSGDNEVVAASSGKVIRVLAYTIVSAGTVTAKWRSATTDISGPMPLVASSGVSPSPLQRYDQCLMQTSAGQALNLNLSGAIAVGGHLTYAYN